MASGRCRICGDESGGRAAHLGAKQKYEFSSFGSRAAYTVVACGNCVAGTGTIPTLEEERCKACGREWREHVADRDYIGCMLLIMHHSRKRERGVSGEEEQETEVASGRGKAV